LNKAANQFLSTWEQTVKKIVIVSENANVNQRFVRTLGTLFPECEIVVVFPPGSADGKGPHEVASVGFAIQALRTQDYRKEYDG